MSWIPACVNVVNFKRGLNMLPHYLIEGNNVQADKLAALVRGTKNGVGKYVGGRGYSNFGGSFKESMLAAENAYKADLAKYGSTGKYITESFKSIPGEISTAWKAGGEAAKAAGKIKCWGALKGAGGAIMKRMPFIGTALYALTTLPNIFKATKDEGIVSGAAEVVKTGISITGFTAGCAIGQALCPIPIVGGLIGGIIGGIIGDKIAGKTYSEKKAEEQEKLMAQTQSFGFDTGSTNPFAANLTPEQQYQLAMLQQQYAAKS